MTFVTLVGFGYVIIVVTVNITCLRIVGALRLFVGANNGRFCSSIKAACEGYRV